MTLILNGGDRQIMIDNILLDELEEYFEGKVLSRAKCSSLVADAPPIKRREIIDFTAFFIGAAHISSAFCIQMPFKFCAEISYSVTSPTLTFRFSRRERVAASAVAMAALAARPFKRGLNSSGTELPCMTLLKNLISSFIIP